MGPREKCNLWGSPCLYQLHNSQAHSLPVSARHLDSEWCLLVLIKAFWPFPQLFRVILWVIKPCQVRGGFTTLSDPRLVSPAQSPRSQGCGSSVRPSNLPRLSCLLAHDHRRGASPKLKLHTVPFLHLISRTPTAWPCDTQSFCENWEGYWQFGSCCSCLCMQRT